MKIGLHAYDPVLGGLTSPSGSVSGTKFWRFIIDTWLMNGHEVIWLGDGMPDGCTKFDGYNVDVGMFVWRWKLPPEYRERNISYYRQQRLMRIFNKLGVPMIVHDEDHKISEKDKKWLLDNHVLLTAPELIPRRNYIKLMFPNPFGPLEIAQEKIVEHLLSYIGNNYERYDQAKKYLGDLPSAFWPSLFGNWIQASPYREGKAKVLEDFPNCKFFDPVSYDQILPIYKASLSTIHLAKESYCRTGFVTLRWAEAAAASCPAFIPFEFAPGERLFGRVTGAEDVVTKLALLLSSSTYYDDMINYQVEFVNENMKSQPWLDILDYV